MVVRNNRLTGRSISRLATKRPYAPVVQPAEPRTCKAKIAILVVLTIIAAAIAIELGIIASALSDVGWFASKAREGFEMLKNKTD